MNYNDDTFKQAVELAKTHQAHPETILPICTTLGRVSRALLAAQAEVESQRQRASEWEVAARSYKKVCDERLNRAMENGQIATERLGEIKELRSRIEGLEAELRGKPPLGVQPSNTIPMLFDEIDALEACLAEKDGALEDLEYISHQVFSRWVNKKDNIAIFMNLMRDECKKSQITLALNPNQYQERVKARERVIEEARKIEATRTASHPGVLMRTKLTYLIADLEAAEGKTK